MLPAALPPNHSLLPSPPSCDTQLVFPPSLTPRQRAAVHAVGEHYGVQHGSTGEGEARRVALGPADAPQTVVIAGGASDTADGGVSSSGGADGGAAHGASDAAAAGALPAPLSDDQLVSLIKQHLGLDAGEVFASMASSSIGGGGGGRAAAAAAGKAYVPPSWNRGDGAAAAKPGAQGLTTPEEFIARVLPLLEMEREAEVAQVGRL